MTFCTEWLGGLVVAQHKSKIEERLGSHLSQLVQVGFLSSYSIEKAKTSPAAGGFVLAFRPGTAFFDDYDRFYRRRKQGELQWDFDADQREIGTPLQVAYLFTEKRTGQPAISDTCVVRKRGSGQNSARKGRSKENCPFHFYFPPYKVV
jgi:hypothetical protein